MEKFKIIKIILCIVLVSLMACVKKDSSLQGCWNNQNDADYSICFNDSKCLIVYQEDTLDVFEYVCLNYSCDANYMSDSIVGDFILILDADSSCYEITSLDDSSLVYRHTQTGVLHVFKR